MRLGLHSYLFTDRWSDASLPLLDRARELGAECFEIAAGDDIVFTPTLTRRRAEALDLHLTIGPGGVWPPECDLSADDPADRALGLAWHKGMVQLAAETGAVAYCGAHYGHPGVVKRRVPPPGELGWTAEGLWALAEYGHRLGVAIVIEPMSHFRTHLLNTPEQGVQMLDRVGHPNLKLLLDTYHMVTEVRDYAAGIRCAGERLWGLHACESDRGVPGGGLVPWDDVFGALRRIAFDGYVMLETYNSAMREFAFGRGMFHDVCPDPAVFSRRGLAFVRRGLRGIGG